MNLEHSFTVPVGIDAAWKILLDIELIGPCMPGATIETVDGDDFTGTVKVKVGPIMLTYKGKASFIEKDEAAHRAIIDARGRDARGNGTAAAKITATLVEQGDSTAVKVLTDLDITGKPAQFGRGVMVDVGNKLIGQFADALAVTISGDSAASGSSGAPAAPKQAAPKQAAPKPTKAAEPAAATAPAAKKTAAASTPAKKTATAAAKKTTTAAAKKTTKATTKKAGPTVDEPAAVEDPAADAAADDAVTDAPPPTEAADVTDHAGDDTTASSNGHPMRRAIAEAEPIDLLASAGPAIARRLIGPAAIALLFILAGWRRRHARRA
jgi:carbon monoxide dehydrogenase subunit G